MVVALTSAERQARYRARRQAGESRTRYRRSGAPSLRQIVPSHAGDRATHVGVEVDLTLRVQLNERLLLGSGYGHLAPGAVIRERIPGGVSR